MDVSYYIISGDGCGRGKCHDYIAVFSSPESALCSPFGEGTKIDGTRRISGGDMNEAYGMTYLPGVKRILLVLAGILLIGMCVAFYRMSGFEVDTFSCMNLGVSGFLKMPFGNWQLIVNAVLLIVVWLTVRHCIGPGTVVNMVGGFFCRSFQLLYPLRSIFIHQQVISSLISQCASCLIYGSNKKII